MKADSGTSIDIRDELRDHQGAPAVDSETTVMVFAFVLVTSLAMLGRLFF